MAKVHPNAAVPEPAAAHAPGSSADEPPTVLTVWRKSLLFNCDGFTVFDARGDLVFRVDCYGSGGRRAEVVLMDAGGKPILTVRRKRLSLAEHRVIYDGDGAAGSRPLLSVLRTFGGGLRASKAVAHVEPLTACVAGAEAYAVDGSYGRRSCAVRDARGDAVAEVRRKESVGDDVFRLVVEPRLGAPLAMGVVIALDGMFGGAGGASARSLVVVVVGILSPLRRVKVAEPTCQRQHSFTCRLPQDLAKQRIIRWFS